MTAVVLLGAPGAGKGTQAPILAERLGIPVVATGDLFRAAVREGTPVGLEARRYMDAGQLVPDEITIRLLRERLAKPDAANGVIFDGFPRTRAQAEALDRTLAEDGARVDRALLIDVPVEELIQRMAGRRICEANGHPFNLATNPPHVSGKLRPRWVGADPARGRQGGDGPAPDGPADPAARGGRRPLPRPRRAGLRRRPACRSTSVSDALLQALEHRGPGRLTMVTRKSKAEIERMRRAGRDPGGGARR